MSLLALSAALSSKFLAAKAIAAMVIGCYATQPDGPEKPVIQIHCFVGTASGEVLSEVESKAVAVPSKGFPLADLSQAYGIGIEAALIEAAKVTPM